MWAETGREGEAAARERGGALHRPDIADDDDLGALGGAHVAERLGGDLRPDAGGIADGDGKRLHWLILAGNGRLRHRPPAAAWFAFPMGRACATIMHRCRI